MSGDIVAAIEAGGTKFVLSVGRDWESAVSVSIPTRSPEETIGEVIDWLRETSVDRPFRSIGLASFGPIGVEATASDYGVVGSTPKPGWSGFDLRGSLHNAFDVPIKVDTDVNGAAIAEALYGAGRDTRTVVYVTVGTGIGAGVAVEGKSLNGFMHPEIGHMRIPMHAADSDFAGACPFHGQCLEGLACGPSIISRWGASLSNLPPGHEAHALQAHYLALMCTNLLLSYMPDRLLIGGGVAKTPGLVEATRERCIELLAGYLPALASADAMAKTIQRPGLGLQSGIAGAFVLAQQALND